MADEMKPYAPSWRDQIAYALADLAEPLGRRAQQNVVGGARGLMDFVPGLGPALAANDAYRAMQVGDYAGAAGNAAVGLMGMAPMAGPAARAGSRLLGREALSPLESRSAGLYNPPAKPPRPIEADYPAGAPADASGRITHDIEGRPLTARHVVGRSNVGEPSQSLGYEGLVSTGESLTREGVGRRAPGDLRGNAGLASFDPDSGAALRIGVSDKLSPEQGLRVLAHEIGHVIDQTAGEIPHAGLSRELAPLYDTLNTGRERTSKFMGPQHLGYKPEEVPREQMAEAIRAYISDPNYIKTVAPKTAARIREYVNSNDSLSKIIQFNAMAGGGVLAYDRLLPGLEDDQ